MLLSLLDHPKSFVVLCGCAISFFLPVPAAFTRIFSGSQGSVEGIVVVTLAPVLVRVDLAPRGPHTHHHVSHLQNNKYRLAGLAGGEFGCPRAA